jgi:hypothetical protein
MEPESSLLYSQVPALRLSVRIFCNKTHFYGEELFPPLLIQYICSYPPYWRPFLHPQPEDVPCCGDRYPLNTDSMIVTCNIYSVNLFTVRSCYYLAQLPSWRTTPCWLSTTAYSIYLQLPSILEAVPPSAT